jgi:hypothetical protein
VEIGKTDVFQFEGFWYFKNEDECSPPIISKQNAKAVARLAFPGAMLLVHK